MRRRAFIAGLGSAAAWPMMARGQPDQMQRIAVLMGISETDLDSGARVAAFQQSLQTLGWMPGRNIRIEYRWGAGSIEKIQAAVAELLEMRPSVILADGTPALRAFHQTRTGIPIVFTIVSEPVAAGFVQSLARPGANITGFTNLEPSVGAKWLELLKEVAPQVGRVGLMFNPETAPFSIQPSRLAQEAAEQFAMQAVVTPVHDPAEIEAVITKIAGDPHSGLVLPQDSFTSVHRKLIVALAARYHLPAVYAFRYFTAEGGLLSYGIDVVDVMRRAANYIDRVLRGEKPADLPVQQPTKLDLVINLKAATALGLTVPPTLIARADEVIE
jgi:putative ABC transport system substrate-binding protein